MTIRWIDDNPFNEDLPVWTRAHVDELLPGPLTPLNWDLLWAEAGAQGWRDAMVDRFGFRPHEIDEERPETIGVFGGYAYVNASLLRVWAARTPALAPNHVDTAYLMEHPELPVHVPFPWHEHEAATDGILKDWLSWVLVDQNQSELEAARLLSLEARANRPVLAELSDGDVLDHALGLRPLCRVLFSHHLNQTLAASIGPGIIAAVCDEIGMPTNVTALISGIGEVESAAPANALWHLSRSVRTSPELTGLFDRGLDGLHAELGAGDDVDVVQFMAGFEALIDEVGYRGSAEWDIFGPTWESHPDLVLAAIDRLRGVPDTDDPAIGFSRREDERRTLVKELGDVVAAKPVTRDHLDAAARATRVFVQGRERSKANLSRVVNEMRVAIAELAERATSRGDVAEPRNLQMLFTDELAYYADGGLAKVREITDERRGYHNWLSRVQPASIIKAPPPSVENWPVEPAATPGEQATVRSGALEPGEVLFAKPGSFGVVRGRARIVTDPAVVDQLDPGDILVAEMTPASWSPLFVGAGAVVVEGGGLLSHAMIICRELGVPCVVRATGATSRVPEGALVEVDGVTGIVTLVEPARPDDTHTAAEEPTVDPWWS